MYFFLLLLFFFTVDCMAGTAIFKKQQKSKNSNTANLNITLHSIPASICCCLWLQQPQVVESNSKKCNTNDRPMKENTSNYCPNSSSSSSSSSTSCCTTDDRILTNYNYNIAKSVKQQQPTKQRPLTLSVAVIIMSLTILLIQMPTVVQSKSIYLESSASADYMEPVAAETSAELESKLLLSLLAEAQSREQHYISSETDDSPSASLDELTAVEVLKHIQRTQEHQKERRMRLRKRHARDLVIDHVLHYGWLAGWLALRVLLPANKNIAFCRSKLSIIWVQYNTCCCILMLFTKYL